MNRYALALCAIITATGCASCDPKPNLCKDVQCVNGACNPDTAKCECSPADQWYGPKCDFDAKDSLAFREVCPDATETIRVTISNAPGSYAALNGYWAEIDPGTFAKCVLLKVNASNEAHVADPAGVSGTYIPATWWMNVDAIDRNNPRLSDGNPNLLQPLAGKKIRVGFDKGRFGVATCDSVALTCSLIQSEYLPANITVAESTHLSSFYPFNRPAVNNGSAAAMGGRVVNVAFTGSTDEGSSLSSDLTFKAWEDGTLLAEHVGNETWDLNLPGGTHNLTLEVVDRYGLVSSKPASVTVDLCTGNACLNWQTCRTVDGVCVGTNPCNPDPCQHGGACSPTGIGTFSCSCNGNWNGADCSLCPSDSYINSLGNCVDDPCKPDPCNGHGSCSNATGSAVCTCAPEFSGSATCNVCGTDYGPAYPTCNPKPTISGLAIDCSGTSNQCVSPFTYPVSWSFTNATSFSTQLTKLSGCSTSLGTLSPDGGSLAGGNKSIDYALGDCTPTLVRVTVTVTGSGGSASSYVDVDYY